MQMEVYPLAAQSDFQWSPKLSSFTLSPKTSAQQELRPPGW